MIRTIADGVRLLSLPLPFPPGHVSAWLLDDGPGLALVDTGYATDDCRAAWEDALGGVPVTRIVVTHHHPDHFGLAAWLAERFAAPVVMTEGEWRRAQVLHDRSDAEAGGRLAAFFARHGMDEDWVEQVRTRGNAYRRGVPNLPAEVHTVRDGETLTIGSRRWRVLADAGHTPEHMTLHCAEARLLISGDQILPRIPPSISVPADAPEADPLADYLRSLERHVALPPETLVLPSHGEPFPDPPNRCRELQAICRRQMARVQARCGGAPHSLADLMEDGLRRPRNLTGLMFEMGGIAAALNHLTGKRVLVRLQDGEGGWRFTTA
jgi:glyoxylase-like metal-dependent hydrolase (beta-lactamase superfamily II)